MAGRKKIDIDYDMVQKLSMIQCTQKEIAYILGLSVRTLQRDEKFNEIYNIGKENGKMSLRRIQFDIAEKGNASMAIFLGKQYLGQRDVVENSNETQNGVITDLVEALNNAKNSKWDVKS